MKLIKIGFLVIILGVCSYAGDSKYFNPSVKVGMNVGWIEALNKNTLCKPTKHYLYPGLNIGFSNEIYFSERYFLQNDLYFRNSYSVFKYDPPTGTGPFFQHYDNNYIQFSILPGINIQDYFKILLGLEIDVILDSEFKITTGKKKNSYLVDKKNISSELPDADYSLAIGLTKTIKIKKCSFIIDSKYLFNLTKFEKKGFESEYRNHAFLISMGYQFSY